MEATPEQLPEPQQEPGFPQNDNTDQDIPEEDLSEETEDEMEELEPAKPATSAVASAQMGGSRAFVAPANGPKPEPEVSSVADGIPASASSAPSATAAKSSSGEASGERSGGKGAVAGSDSGSAPPPAPLIIRDWGSVGGGFVPFGATVSKTAPKGGKVRSASASLCSHSRACTHHTFTILWLKTLAFCLQAKLD